MTSAFKRWAFFSCLIIPLVTLVAQEDALHLTYRIRPIVENEKPALEVEAEFEGNEGGTTEIILPSSWAGQEELYHQINILECSGKIENTDLEEIKKIEHDGHSLVRIKYVVTSEEKKEGEDWYYRPIIKKDYFFFFGHCFFILPKKPVDSVGAFVSLEWRDVPATWKLANSFQVGQNQQELMVPVDTLLHSVFTGGNIALVSCGDKKNPIIVAGIGDLSFSLDRLVKLVPQIVESQRHFWNDFDFPYFLVTVLSTGEDRCYLGGTTIFQAFSLFLGGAFTDEKDWKMVAWLLSHEHFHVWNGIKMTSDAQEGALYWFSEGFTEYYANILNFKNHIFTASDYVESVNNMLHEYFVSPVHNARNERIVLEFWKDLAVQRLPYVRGFLLALHWNKKIQQATDAQCCLDDFMLALFKKVQMIKKPFSEEDFKQVLSLYLPREIVEEDIRRYITNGETINPEEDDLGDLYTLEWSKQEPNVRAIPQFTTKK
jgi:predicted metalloprotease with PDZ domain